MVNFNTAVLVVTVLMAAYTARESIHELRKLLKGLRTAWAVGRLRSVAEIVAISLMAMGHGLYYWIMTVLIIAGGPVGH